MTWLSQDGNIPLLLVYILIYGVEGLSVKKPWTYININKKTNISYGFTDEQPLES